MSSPVESPTPANQQLPPVEPPGAGFLLQLFVIPAVIVVSILLVWGLFVWLAQKGNDVETYLKALERNTPARWQAAVSLADTIRHAPDAKIRSDEEVARRLSAILRRELDGGSTTNLEALRLRAYLCNALGEFRVPGLLPELERAAVLGPTPEEVGARFAALKSITVYIGAMADERRASRDRLLALFRQAAVDPAPLIRSTATFALAELDDPAALETLVSMLADAHADVRYNAATMLARRGQTQALDTLVEMLAPDVTVVVEMPADDTSEKSRQSAELNKRMAIHINALRAARSLADAQPQGDYARLWSAVEKLGAADVSQPVKLQVAEALGSRREK